jgi:uncharacterized membrane protein
VWNRVRVDEAPIRQPAPKAPASDPIDPKAPRRGAWATMWHLHPTVRKPEELTVGERSADYMRKGMGSWAFVFAALIFLAGWIIINVVEKRNGQHAFDAYPFILLNLCLSCLAAMQGAILLIAAKRSDQISSELAAHDLEVNERSEQLIQENTDLTRIVKDLTEAIHHLLTTGAAKPQPGEQR